MSQWHAGRADGDRPGATEPTPRTGEDRARGRHSWATRLAEAERDDDILPAWRRPTAGEHRWPAAVAILVAIALQVLLPSNLAFQPRWLLPGIEAALFVVLVVANPRRINRESTVLRLVALAFMLVASIATLWSAGLLIYRLVYGDAGSRAGPLLVNGGAIWLTNVIVFALWYWEADRGGPAARANARQDYPDFVFVQMTSPELARREWEPQFVDYLYLSFTNATAFSPTDTLPLSRWAKLAMMAQSAVSLTTVALVIARAVNILRGS
jgi:hypothetical protein